MISPGVRTASNASQATSPGASGTNPSHLATSPGVELFTQSGDHLPSIFRNGPCPAPRDVASASASAPRPFHRATRTATGSSPHASGCGTGYCRRTRPPAPAQGASHCSALGWTSNISENIASSDSTLRRALHERTVFDQDHAGLARALRHRRVLGVGRQSLAIALARGETREIDQAEPDVGGSGEFRRREVADDLAAAALDGTGHGTGIGLEVGELGGVECVADAQCEHDGLLVAGVWPRDARASTRNASIQPQASGLGASALTL